jgi:hypothetical protein
MKAKFSNRVEIKLTRYQSIRKGLHYTDYLKVKEAQRVAREAYARADAEEERLM